MIAPRTPRFTKADFQRLVIEATVMQRMNPPTGSLHMVLGDFAAAFRQAAEAMELVEMVYLQRGSHQEHHEKARRILEAP